MMSLCHWLVDKHALIHDIAHGCHMILGLYRIVSASLSPEENWLTRPILVSSTRRIS